MRCRVSERAALVLAWSLAFPAVAGKTDATSPPVPALTAAAHVPAADITAAVPQAKEVLVPSDDAGDGPVIRPWLALLAGVVLAGAMARRRL